MRNANYKALLFLFISINVYAETKFEFDDAILRKVTEDNDKANRIIPYSNISKETPKVQKLISECASLHKVKEPVKFNLEDNITNSKPFDKTKARATIWIKKKNRFNEEYLETQDCIWNGPNYELYKIPITNQFFKN